MRTKVAFLVLVGVFGLVIRGVSGMPYVWAFALSAAAIFINGLIATLEDDLPGGFSNPDGTDTPLYVRKVAATVRWIGSLVLVCIAFMLIAAVARGALSVGLGVGLGVASGLLGAALFWRSRLAVWGSAVSLVFGIGSAMFRT